MIPDSFFPALLNQLVQVSCVAVLAILVTRWTRGTRPHLVHAVWLIVFLKCITPPILSSPTSPFSWLQVALVDSEGNRGVNIMYDWHSDSKNRAAVPSTLRPNTAADSLVETDNLSAMRGVFNLSSALHSFRRQASSLSSMQILLLSWLIVAGVIFAIFTCQFLKFLRWVDKTKLRGEKRSEYSMRLNGLVARIEVKLGMRHRTRVEVVDALIGPAIVGIFKPTILLPKVIVDRVPDKHLEMLIAHELVHFRRGDLWWSALQTLAVCGYWFHPLVWLARSVMNREEEKCCDEETIGSLRCEPGEYARCLISVLECKHLLRAAPLLPGVRPVDVTTKRLERIMRLRQGCHSQCPRWVRITLVIGAITLLPGAALTFAQQEGSKAPAAKTDGPALATPLPLLTPSQQDSPSVTADHATEKTDYELESMDITDVLNKLQETEKVTSEQAVAKLLAGLPSPKAQVERMVDIDNAENAVKMGGDYPNLKIAGNRLYVLGTENERGLIRKYLEHYRHFGNQFLVYEVRILDVPTESLDALALRWDWQQTTKEKHDPNETIKNDVVPASFASTRTLSTSKTGQFDSSQIKALLKCDRCNLLMAPKISGLSSQSVQVHQGNQFSFVVGHAAVMGEDGMPTNTFQPQIELVEEGVKLELEGRGIENAPSKLSVRLKITHTEILDVWESTIEKGGQEYPIQQPRVSSKFIETAFEQKLGLTSAIAGEPEMVETVVERGVPILGKIPYVNRLFKNVAIHSELRTQVVLVTCRLEGGKEELAAAVSQSTETSPEKSGSLTDERTSTRRPSK
jgi:beta-lactamase regulating signal transducer with metallopeptidase domain